MRCPDCGTSITPQAETCLQCGVRIVWDGGTAEFYPPETFVPVFVAYDPAMLPVVESLLTANGIPFVVPNEVTQDIMGLGRLAGGYNLIVGPPVVRVSSEHAQAASKLIASVTEASSGELTPEG